MTIPVGVKEVRRLYLSARPLFPLSYSHMTSISAFQPWYVCTVVRSCWFWPGLLTTRLGVLEWPHTKCAYEVSEVASLSDSSVLVALQQISYSDSNYDTMSVDTEYNNVSTQIYYRLKFTANCGHCHSN